MSQAHRGARRRPTWVRWVVLAGVALVLVWTGWIVVRGLIARDQLTSAVPVAHELRDTVVGGDEGHVDALVAELKQRAATAASMTHDPVWRVTEFIPWIGPNLTAVRQVTEIVQTLSDTGIDPLISAAASFDPDAFAITDGHIDLAPIIAIQPDVAAANDAMSAAAAQADAIDVDATIGPVRDAVTQLLTLVGEVTGSVDALDRTAHLLPAMLGNDGPRTTLVLIQNNAELRSSGGISGALALVTGDHGAIEFGEQASTRDFPERESSILPLDDATRTLYGEITGKFIQDVNLTPWFDTSAQLAKAMWEERKGGTVDAVVAVDPVLLSYLLDATGPVQVGDIILTSDNAVSILLSETYARYWNPDDQDAFFAAAAQGVFAALTAPDVKPAGIVEALVRGGDERRIRIWNSRPDEQRFVDGTTLSGVQPADNSAGPELGFFLNDGTGAKMNYYTDLKVEVAGGVCRADGIPSYRVTGTFTNNAPADAATSLPGYVTGDGAFGVEPGKVKTLLAAYGPVGGIVQGATLNGEEAFGVGAIDRGRPVFLVQTLLAPGETAVFSVDFNGEAGTRGPLSVAVTPTLNDTETQHRSLVC
ncbi:DUF4012 domain-containing protein [Protaetiibacter larvae]|uniref:DUF4012 domain-containing protein n=1 Tax=Protaetiibacter larvae TaxID=2592654 RepID=A0A5C1Y794_9MICO|nr:DUF4012 domain-containing protein [Protaetiibacter larvae]QEO09520.1 DUF4012 domain-containing protein [Protaetiibacter larvae]